MSSFLPERTDDWFLPRDGGLSFGGGGRGPERVGGGAGLWLAKINVILIYVNPFYSIPIF